MSEKSVKKGRRKTDTKTRSQKKSDDTRPSTTDAVGSPREEDPTSPARPKSPEANCSICLGELQNKSFTDTCFHTFCFTCLLEWSKVKPVCPLCKQTFNSIIHNVRSIQDYDQYELRHANNAAAEENARSFQYRTTLTQDRWLSRQQRDQARQLRLLERPSVLTTRSHWQRIRQTATSDFRRRVYAEGLRVQEAEQEPGRPRRERNITPEFFQRNPACTHRLVPWLNRELNVLLHNHEDHVQFLLELIVDLIKSYEIGGEVFRTHLDSILGHRTDHFVHEFIHFARSPYDMCRYDSTAVYHVNPREVDPLSVLTVDSSSDSDDNNDEEPDIVILSPTDPSGNSRDHSYFSRGLNPEPPAERRGYFSDITAPTPNPLIGQVRGFLSSVDTADTAHSGWESPIPGPSSLYWSPPHPGSPTMNGTDTTPDSIQVVTDMESITEIPQQPGPSNPGDSDSDDECLITAFEKPFEERSPMLLSSEDDLETLMAKSRGKRAKKESDRRRKRDQRRSRTPLQYRVQSKSKSKSPPAKRRRSTSRTRQGSRSRQRSGSRSRAGYNSNTSNNRDRRRRSRSVDRRNQRSRSRDRTDRRRRSRSRSRGSERSGASRRNNRRSKSRSPVRNRRKSRSRSRGEANSRRDGRRSRSRDKQAGRSRQNRRNDDHRERRPRSESIEAVVRRLNNAQRGGLDSRGNRRSRDRRSRSWDRRSRSRTRRSRSRTRRSRSRDRRSQARRSQGRDRRSRSRGGRSRSPRRRSQSRRSRSKDGRSDCKKSTSGHKKSENGEVKMPEIKIKLEPASWTVASPERLGSVSKKRRPTGNDTHLSVDSTSRDTSIVELHSISHSTPQSVVTDDGSNTGLSNGPSTPNTNKLNHGQSVEQSTSSAATDNNHCYTSKEKRSSSSNGEKRENLNGGKNKSSSSSSKSSHSSDSQKSAVPKDKTNQSQSSASGETSSPSQSGAAVDISLNCADRNVDLNELEKQMREKLTNRLKGATDSSQNQSDKDTIAKLF